MDEDAAQRVTLAIERVRAEVGSIAQMMNWAAGALVVGVILVACDPAKEPEALVGACAADAMRAGFKNFDARMFSTRCMDGKGFDFRYELEACGLEFAHSSHDCYEKRGAWRSIKQEFRSWREWWKAKK